MNGTINLSTGYKRCLIVGIDSTVTQAKVNELEKQFKQIFSPLIDIVIVPGLQGVYGVIS